jgi:hypothetical protein
MNATGSTTNYRLLSAVRVNKITLTTAVAASLEWLSEFGPTSATLITGGTATTPGFLIQRPPQKSTAGYWSQIGVNESQNMLSFTCAQYDYIDVDYSGVIIDRTPSSCSTTASGSVGVVYRTYLDGPNGASSQFAPVAVQSLN